MLTMEYCEIHMIIIL